MHKVAKRRQVRDDLHLRFRGFPPKCLQRTFVDPTQDDSDAQASEATQEQHSSGFPRSRHAATVAGMTPGTKMVKVCGSHRVGTLPG